MKTAGSKLVEQAKNDYYWGVGADGSGKNMLGVLLMKLRDGILELSHQQQQQQQGGDEKVDEKNFRALRSKINGALRETGVNLLRKGSGAPGDAAFGFGLAASISSSSVATTATTSNNQNNQDDDDKQEEEEKSAPKKKKNRIQ